MNIISEQLNTIETSRLRLQLCSMELFDLCLIKAKLAAEQYANVLISNYWLNDLAYIKMRREQLAADPTYSAWCMRMIVHKDSNRMVGHIGFHTPPDPPELRAIAPGGIEFGYRVFAPYRRKGYATEAARGLIRWAAIGRGIRSFVVSIAPRNAPSQALANRLGFIKVGEQIDDVDGLEDVLLLKGDTLERLLV